MSLSMLIWNELRLMMYLDRCLCTEGERRDHTICTYELTPQYVDMERTEGWEHARGATYLAGHVSPPSGVVTIGRDPVIASTPTLLLHDSVRAWHGDVAVYRIEYRILPYGVRWDQGMSTKEYQSECTVTVS